MVPPHVSFAVCTLVPPPGLCKCVGTQVRAAPRAVMRLVLFRSFLHARGCPAARLSQLAAAASSFDGVELSLRQLTPSVFDACEHASLRISCRLSLRADEEADRQLDQLSSVLATHRAAESLLETVIVSSDAAGAGPEATAEGLAELVALLC